MRSRNCGVLVVTLALMLVPGDRLVQASQSFDGFFDWSNPSYVGEDVHVTVTVELVNRTGSDAYDVTVTLEGVGDPEEYGDIWVDDLASDSPVEASGEVVVPGWEYDAWNEGAHPRFRVDFTDTNGNAVQEWIDLLHLPLGES